MASTSAACMDSAFVAALERWPNKDHVGLYVDEENEVGVRFWKGYGFSEWGKHYEEADRRYIRMVASTEAVVSAIKARNRAA